MECAVAGSPSAARSSGICLQHSPLWRCCAEHFIARQHCMACCWVKAVQSTTDATSANANTATTLGRTKRITIRLEDTAFRVKPLRLVDD